MTSITTMQTTIAIETSGLPVLLVLMTVVGCNDESADNSASIDNPASTIAAADDAIVDTGQTAF
jgi:hypothetical protein